MSPRSTQDGVQQVTGRPAMSVREFVLLHSDKFGGFDAWRERNYPAEARVLQASTISNIA